MVVLPTPPLPMVRMTPWPVRMSSSTKPDNVSTGGSGGGFGGGGNWGGADGDGTFGVERYASFGGKARERAGGGRYLDTTNSVSGYTREPIERRGDPRFRTQRKDERAERMVSLLGGRGEAADWRK